MGTAGPLAAIPVPLPAVPAGAGDDDAELVPATAVPGAAAVDDGVVGEEEEDEEGAGAAAVPAAPVAPAGALSFPLGTLLAADFGACANAAGAKTPAARGRVNKAKERHSA